MAGIKGWSSVIANSVYVKVNAHDKHEISLWHRYENNKINVHLRAGRESVKKVTVRCLQ